MSNTANRTSPAAVLTQAAAADIIRAALGAAGAAGVGMAVAVVDAGGALRSFGRSDGAPP